MRYERWAVILHPLGPSTINCYEKWRYLGAPFGGAGTAQAVTEGVLFHWQDTPSVKNQRFLPPPSKREARKRQIPIFVTVYGRGAQRMHKEAPEFVTYCQRRLAAGRGAQRMLVDHQRS